MSPWVPIRKYARRHIPAYDIGETFVKSFFNRDPNRPPLYQGSRSLANATEAMGPAPKFSRKKKTTYTRRKTVSRASPNKVMSPIHELGYYDMSNTTAFSTTASSANITFIGSIQNGTADNQRTGRKIRVKSLQVHGRAYNLSTAAANKCCIMVIWDQKPKGVIPAMTDILQGSTSLDFPNVENTQRFTVLKRLDFTLLGNTASLANVTSMTERHIDFYVNLGGRIVTYGTSGTGAIGDIEEGAIYIVTVGSSASGTNAADFGYYCRLRFWDV